MKNAIINFKKYRYLLKELINKDIKLKYRRSYLGLLWTLLEPLLTMIVLTFVFSGLFGRGDESYPIYILTGRLLYTFFSTATKSAMKSIRSNAGMIKKVYVPKYIYPFAATLSNYIIFLLSLIVLALVSIVLNVMPTIYIFNAIFPLILILVLSLGVGMILSTLAVFFRDLEYLWGVFLMFIMYTSAIFYQVEKLKIAGKEWIFNINPLYNIIVNFRNAIFGRPIDKYALLYSSCFSFGSLIIGMFIFYKNQDKFILHI